MSISHHDDYHYSLCAVEILVAAVVCGKWQPINRCQFQWVEWPWKARREELRFFRWMFIITLILLDAQRQDNTRGVVVFFYGSATSPVKVRGSVSQNISRTQTLTCELFAVANLLVTSAKVVSSYVFTLTFCLSVCMSVCWQNNGVFTLTLCMSVCLSVCLSAWMLAE